MGGSSGGGGGPLPSELVRRPLVYSEPWTGALERCQKEELLVLAPASNELSIYYINGRFCLTLRMQFGVYGVHSNTGPAI
ncbi:hypothetical protein Y1Q_0009262 [Alligator mississippiensis]|uniref:Uncharacterized protein n=1 Tax=Alligator mississippiensis TaxID=8496 RepID=A0A151M2V0_ALLMI|nr:hypothetical protein Y1Q_0009262 [Alligator mississippiensis]